MDTGIGVAGSRVQELLERIVDTVGVDAQVLVREDEEEVHADLEGTRETSSRSSPEACRSTGGSAASGLGWR